MLATRPPLTSLLRAQRPREGRSDASIFVALFSRSPTRPIPVRFVCVCFACPSVRAVRVRARTKTWERGRRRLGCPLSILHKKHTRVRARRPRAASVGRPSVGSANAPSRSSLLGARVVLCQRELARAQQSRSRTSQKPHKTRGRSWSALSSVITTDQCGSSRQHAQLATVDLQRRSG